MKKIILIIVLILISLFVFAETKKTGISPTKSGIWYLDFEAAKVAAKKEKKPILLLFTGSDWCGACKSLDKKVFQTTEFKNYAKKNLILVKIDCLKHREQSEAIKKQQNRLRVLYGQEGFPSSYFLNSNGDVIGLIKGNRDNYMKIVKEVLSKNK